MEKSLKILLLEDSPSDAYMLQRLLQKEQLVFECRLAVNKKEYLMGLDEFVPDLIISDNNLPGFSATEALEIYHQRSLSVPFILVTGTVSEEFAAEIIKLGADDYILKDRLTRLPSAIDNALKQRKSELEKQEAVEKLRQSEENLSSIFDNTSEGFILADKNCIVRAFNENAKKYALFQTPNILMAGESLFGFIEPARKDYIRQMMNKVLTGEKIQYDRLYEMGIKSVWLNYSITPVCKNDSIVGICITAKDITERKKAEDRQLNEQKEIGRAIIKAEESERNHLGQELHDNINQILAGVKIYLDKARNDFAILEDPLSYPMELIDISMKEIRMLCRNLVTPFNHADLKEQVHFLLDSLDKNLGVHTHMEYDVKHTIGDDQKLNIYRIFQEQVNNIIKHAFAKHVTIRLTSDEKFITIVTADDGKGFDLHQERKGIGLSNMINRVELFHGTIFIETAPGKGCKTRITLPLLTY